MFILDTNVLSNSRKPKPPPALAKWLREQVEIAIPFPSILEVEQGIAELYRTKPDKAEELRAWIDSVLVGRHYYPAITPAVARTLAQMYCCRPLKNFWYTGMPSQKERKPGQDLFIASVAINYSLPIATSDTRDFEYINRFFPLPGIYDPIIDKWAVVQCTTAEVGADFKPSTAMESSSEDAPNVAKAVYV